MNRFVLFCWCLCSDSTLQHCNSANSVHPLIVKSYIELSYININTIPKF